jgi:hypothetical protein
MGNEEMNLDFKGSYTFEDLESGRRLKADTVVQGKPYAERIKQWVQKSRTWMLEKQISYHLVLMHEPFEKVLRDFLKVRKTLAR